VPPDPEEIDTRVDQALSAVRAQGESDLPPDASLGQSALLTGALASVGPTPDPADVLRGGLETLDLSRHLEPGDLLGRGGMGEVRVARERALGRDVALKTARGERAAAALLEEARLTGALEHPNVVPVHRLGVDDAGRPVLVMKRVVGTSWLELLRDPAHAGWAALPADRLRANVGILIQVANALHYAHSRGLLHRDVKPANVMVGEFGEVYLVDWGLAARLDRVAGAEPQGLVGTPAYMAPEMLGGLGGLSARTDVYLLGATLHHVLTGAPRHGRSGHLGALASAVRSEPVAYGAEVPAELAELCNRATRRDPAGRPESALAFRRALEDFLEHRGSVELTERSDEQLAALERALAEPDGPDPTGLLAACRFGYRQALHVWPENAAARAGLQRALELGIERALGERDAGHARALLAELPAPRADLAERLAALDAALAEAAAAQARLAALERDRDLRVGGRRRGWATVGLALLGYVALVGVVLGLRSEARQLDAATSLAFGLGLGVAMLAPLAVWGRDLLATEVSRRAVGMAAGLWLALMYHAFLCWAYDLPYWVLTLYAGVIMACGCMFTAVAVDRRLWIPAGVGAAGNLVGLVAPGIDPMAGHVGFGLVVFTLIAALWLRDPPQ